MVELGQIVFVPVRIARLVVEAKVDEIHDVYTDGTKTLWHSYDLTGRSTITIAGDAKCVNGRPEYTELTQIPKEFRKVNEFPWVDFPIGHAAYINEYAFCTLEDALYSIAPSNKKHLRRRLKKYLKRWERECEYKWHLNRGIYTRR